MYELKKNVMQIINVVNQGWVEELKAAEKEGRGIDLSEMMGKFSDNLIKLDQHFLEVNERLKKNKKGWF